MTRIFAWLDAFVLWWYGDTRPLHEQKRSKWFGVK